MIDSDRWYTQPDPVLFPKRTVWSWMVYKGKSQSKLDDEQGYPHVWKRPFVCSTKFCWPIRLIIIFPLKNLFSMASILFFVGPKFSGFHVCISLGRMIFFREFS